MARVTRHKSWSRWAGGFNDLVDAVRFAEKALSEQSKDGECRKRIDVILPSLSWRMDSADELEALDTRDVPQIREVSVLVEQAPDLYPDVSIRLRRSIPGASLEVTGEDARWVEGVTAQLGAILDRGRSRGSQKLALASFVIGFAGLFAVGFIGEAVFGEGARIVGGLVLGWIVLAALTTALLAFLFVPMEILVPGQQTRPKRFRIGIVAFVLSALASVVGTVIWVLVTWD